MIPFLSSFSSFLDTHVFLECLGMCVFKPFFPWWQWRLVVKAMQWVASRGSGTLLVASALSPPLVLPFPNTHTYTHAHSLTLTPALSHAQTQALVIQHTQPPGHISTETSEEKTFLSCSLGEMRGTKPGI